MLVYWRVHVFFWERTFQTQGLCHLYSFFSGESFGQSQDAYVSPVSTVGGTEYMPQHTFLGAYRPTHPKRPQMNGIPSVGAWNSRDMLENSFLYESFFGRFSHVKIHWGERSYPTCWNGSLGCKKIWLPHLLVLFLWRLAVSNPERGIMFHVMFCIFTHRNPWSWYMDSMDLPTWEP